MKYIPKNPERAGIQGKRLEDRCLVKFNKPFARLVMDCKASGMSLNATAKHLDCKRETLARAIRRNNLDWPSDTSGNNHGYYAITINKVTATKAEHCRRAGVTYDSVEYYQSLHNLSFPEALKIAIARKQRESTRLS